jgi:hypothetical protein
MTTSEKEIYSGSFGVVTDRRVTYYSDKNWFSGGKREDVPIKQIVSIRYEVSRRLFWGVLLIIIGASFLIKSNFIGIFLLILGGIFLWGSPSVNVITSGGTGRPTIGYPWLRKDAESFAAAIRAQLFEKSDS